MLRAAFSLALSAVVVFATASVVVRLVSDEPVANGTRATGLAWSDRVFTSKQEFAEFLASRDVAYEDWAARHPRAAPWQRSAAPARADGTDRGEAAARRGPQPAQSAAPAKPAAPEATATPTTSSRDELSSRFVPAALVLLLVTLLLLAARRVGLRPAVVAVTAAGPALDRPRGRRPRTAKRPPVSTARAAVAVVTGAPAPRAETVHAPAPDGAAEPGRPLGVRLRGLISAAAAAVRATLTSIVRSTATLGAVLGHALAAARAGVLVRRREAAPREAMPAHLRVARAGATLARLATRAGAAVAHAMVAGVESVRWFLRRRGFNALDAATYSLAIVAAAGIGVVVAFVAGR